MNDLTRLYLFHLDPPADDEPYFNQWGSLMTTVLVRGYDCAGLSTNVTVELIFIDGPHLDGRKTLQ